MSKRSVPAMRKANPQVYLELSIDKKSIGQITFELFADTVPVTAENFRALCTGEKGRGQKTKKKLYLENTPIYRIVRGFVAQGGDLDNRNGLVGESVYGGTFTDENFKRKHDARGLLSMANTGPHSNGSHFFITLRPLPKLDGEHVVFGKVIKGIELLDQLEVVSSDNGKPYHEVLISKCAEVDTNTQDELPGIEDSSHGNSNADHRKRSLAKDKHTERMKKRPRNSDYSHRKKDKSSKRRKHDKSKSERSRRRHRRNSTSSSDDSGDNK